MTVLRSRRDVRDGKRPDQEQDKMAEYDLRRLQLEQLTVLDELKRVCEAHGLTFYLAYGSCLGALRHGGFIPWDDDIDILMPVEDYDRLMKLAGEFGDGFFLQNHETDPGFPCAIARVRKNGTACVEESEADLQCHQGVFVDIYPQYQYPDRFLQRARIVLASVLYRILLMNRAPANHGILVRAAGSLALGFLSLGGRERNLRRYYRTLRHWKNTEYVADLYGMDLTLTRVIKYRQEWFGEPRWTDFEGRRMPVPTGAEAYLAERYGADYMQLPPEEKRHSYHRYAYVDLNGEYRKENR